MKKIYFILSAIPTIVTASTITNPWPWSSYSQEITFSDQQAKDYVRNIVNSIWRELAPLTPYVTYANLKKWAGKIYVQSGSYRTKNMLDQIILSALVELVEEVALNRSYDQIADHSIAQKISESMRNNAIAIIEKEPYAYAQRIKPFISGALQKAIDDYTAQQQYYQASSYWPY